MISKKDILNKNGMSSVLSWDEKYVSYECEYVDGKQNGQYKSYSDFRADKPFLDEEGKVVNGQRVGEWRGYFSNGNLKYKGSFSNKLESQDYGWFSKKDDKNINDDLSKREGEWIFYNEDGTKEAKGNFVNGIMNGNWEFWFSGEIFKCGGNYNKDGWREGEWTENHLLYFYEGFYKNGLRSGRWFKSFNFVDKKGKKTTPLDEFNKSYIKEMNTKGFDGIEDIYDEDGRLGMIRIVEKDYGFDEEYVPISPKVDYFTGVQTKTKPKRDYFQDYRNAGFNAISDSNGITRFGNEYRYFSKVSGKNLFQNKL